MEEYTTGTGQNLLVHDSAVCDSACVIHSPSNHHMRTWPTNWRDDTRIMERICPHGIGHPDPDAIAFIVRELGDVGSSYNIHGCDGCCTPKELP